MKHLSPEEFVELLDPVEGVRAEARAAHLSACAACRRELADLRASVASLSAAGDDVPEPSPLFWDHFSARVRAAVAAEGAPRRRGLWEVFGAGGRPGWWGAMPLVGTLALVTVAVVLTSYLTAPGVPVPPASAAGELVVTDEASLSPLEATDDPVLTLIADLMSTLDLEAASEALLPGSAHAGGADDVVSTLTEDERRELQRLLQDELAKPRA